MRIAGVTAPTMLLLAAVAAPSYAQLSIGAGMERYLSSINATDVKEKGWRRAYWVQFIQPERSGWLLGYQGKFYTSNKIAFTQNTAGAPLVEDTEEYRGMAHEIQLRGRAFRGRNRQLSGLMAVGYDRWRQHFVTGDADTDYEIGYLRFGLESDTFDAGGWLAGAGVKLPVWSSANLHLDTAVPPFDQNPRFRAKGNLSPYAQVGYRIISNISVIAYADSYHLSDSNPRSLSIGGVPYTPDQVLLARDTWTYGIRLELSVW